MTALLASFFTLTLLEIILGIDNLIFLALVVGRVAPTLQKKARWQGLTLALGMRIVLLAFASWVASLTEPVITLLDFSFSWKDFLMLAGGLFLLGKTTLEMHHEVAGLEHKEEGTHGRISFTNALIQIVIINIVFSFDSVITAVGLTNSFPVMVAAIVVSMLVMLAASNFVTRFLTQNPTFKVLAFSFILMIGMMLVAEGLHFHVPHGYIYFSFGFAVFVESINTLARKKRMNKKGL